MTNELMVASGITQLVNAEDAAEMYKAAKESPKFIVTLKASLMAAQIAKGVDEKLAKKKAGLVCDAVQAARHAGEDNRVEAHVALDTLLDSGATFEGVNPKNGRLNIKKMSKGQFELASATKVAQALNANNNVKLSLKARAEGKVIDIDDAGNVIVK